jgi:hypothetical protein
MKNESKHKFFFQNLQNLYSKIFCIFFKFLTKTRNFIELKKNRIFKMADLAKILIILGQLYNLLFLMYSKRNFIEKKE